MKKLSAYTNGLEQSRLVLTLSLIALITFLNSGSALAGQFDINDLIASANGTTATLIFTNVAGADHYQLAVNQVSNCSSNCLNVFTPNPAPTSSPIQVPNLQAGAMYVFAVNVMDSSNNQIGTSNPPSSPITMGGGSSGGSGTFTSPNPVPGSKYTTPLTVQISFNGYTPSLTLTGQFSDSTGSDSTSNPPSSYNIVSDTPPGSGNYSFSCNLPAGTHNNLTITVLNSGAQAGGPQLLGNFIVGSPAAPTINPALSNNTLPWANYASIGTYSVTITGNPVGTTLYGWWSTVQQNTNDCSGGGWTSIQTLPYNICGTTASCGADKSIENTGNQGIWYLNVGTAFTGTTSPCNVVNYKFELDNQAPQVSFGTPSTPSSNGFYGGNTTIPVTTTDQPVGAPGGNSGVQTISYSWSNGGGSGSLGTTSPANVPAPTSGSNPYTLSITATDNANNSVTTNASNTYAFDTTSPYNCIRLIDANNASAVSDYCVPPAGGTVYSVCTSAMQSAHPQVCSGSNAIDPRTLTITFPVNIGVWSTDYPLHCDLSNSCANVNNNPIQITNASGTGGITLPSAVQAQYASDAWGLEYDNITGGSGLITIQTVASDSVGNLNPTSNSLSWTINLQLPNLNPASVTGMPKTGTTNVITYTITNPSNISTLSYYKLIDADAPGGTVPPQIPVSGRC